MIEVLLLGRQYGYPPLQEALEKALDLSCFDAQAVRLLLTAPAPGSASRVKRWRSAHYEPMTDRNQQRGTTTSCWRTIRLAR